MYLICLLLTPVQAVAEVTASLNQTAYYQGDIISLKIETDKNQKIDPDLSVLEKDFEVKGSSTSSQINIINGNRSYKKTWNIELQAKAIGQLTIPEISLGNEKSNAITLNIKKLPPEVTAETNKHIFIESSVDIQNDEIYVQQQIPYTVKFFYDAAMRTGEVVLPEIENANIRVVGKEKKYQVVRAGNKYVVVERRYVISPEKSGRLVIPPTQVKGRIALTGGDSPQLRKRMNEVDMLNELFFDLNSGSTFSNPFDPFFSRRAIGPTRPYVASSQSIEVNVLPVPESFTGTAWLPAEEIKMQDSWTTNPPNLKIGEPVTRSIIMQVKGLASSQIPEIEIPKPDGMKVYPEQAKSETPNDGNTIYGIQRIDISYIPNKSGAVNIPAINVDWWDVLNKKQQTYSLPAWNLNVTAGAIKHNEIVAAEPEQLKETTPVDKLVEQEEVSEVVANWRWEALVAMLMILLGFLWLLYFFFKRFKKSPKHILNNIKRQAFFEAQEVRGSLLKACEANDNEGAAELLIKHLQFILDDTKIQSLGAIVSKLSNGGDVVKELEASLYSGNSDTWQGNKLYQLISNGLQIKDVKQKKRSSILAPLYPE